MKKIILCASIFLSSTVFAFDENKAAQDVSNLVSPFIQETLVPNHSMETISEVVAVYKDTLNLNKKQEKAVREFIIRSVTISETGSTNNQSFELFLKLDHTPEEILQGSIQKAKSEVKQYEGYLQAYKKFVKTLDKEQKTKFDKMTK